MVHAEVPSRIGASRTAWRAITAASLGLLVVGAGASLGMSSPSHRDHISAGGLAVGPGGPTPQGPPSSAAPQTTTTTAAPTATSLGAIAAAQSHPTPGSPVLPAPAAGGVVPAPVGGAGLVPSTTTTVAPRGGDTPPVAQLPAPGTYSYDTSGSQQISILGATNYPSRTPVVVSGDGCGVASTWEPSAGNSETVVECPASGGLRVVSESSTVSQDGYSTTQNFTCDPDAFIPVTTGQVGQTWTWQCRSSNGETSKQVVRLLGPRTAAVGGIPVSATEVEVSSTLSGPEQGTMTSDYWLTSNATPVKQTGDINVAAGAITYRSQYSLQLVSLTPTT